MKITAIKTTHLRLPDVRPIGDGLQNLLIIEVHTDEGLVGIGEAHTMPVAIEAIIKAPVSQWAVQGLELLLIGKDPRDIQGLWNLMWAQCASVLGGRGLVMHAISGIDLALWDLLGKIENKPVAELLGKKHDQVRVYASDLMPDTYAGLLDQARSHLDRGFDAMKFGWGKLGKTPQDDVNFVGQLRSELGSDFDLMIDIGRPMPLNDAIWLTHELARHGVTFLEEPLDAADLDGYAHLSAESPIPIAAGERETGFYGFRDLVERARLQIIQPDLARCGGITVARKIQEVAEQAGTRIVPHCWASDILVAASVHFMGSTTPEPLSEFNVMQQPLRTDLLLEPMRPVGGRITIPDGPGLGIALNPDTIERFRVN